MKNIRSKKSWLPVAGCCLLAAFAAGSCRPHEPAPQLALLREQAKRHFMERNIDSAICYAGRLRALADLDSAPHEYIAALVYLGQGHMARGNSDSMWSCFRRAGELAAAYGDDWALGTINNALGIQSLYNRLDAKRSIDYLLAGLRHAERAGDGTLTAMLECNLALAYYIRRDPAGLEYAQDVYRTGCRQQDAYLIYCGALTSAYMYSCVGEVEKARRYIVEALPLARTYKDEHGVYTLYGDILLKSGREAEARACYDRALATNNPEDRFSGIDIYLSYGNYLKGLHRYEQALAMLESGIAIADRNANTVNRYLLYEAAAQICSLMQDRAGCVRYTGLYEKERDSLFNVENERSIAALKVSYERDRFAGMIRSTESDVRRAKSVQRAVVSGCALLAVCAVALLRRLRRRERNLLAMLARQRDRFSPDRAALPCSPPPQAPQSQAPQPCSPPFQAPPPQAPLSEALSPQAPSSQAPSSQALSPQAPPPQAPLSQAPLSQAPLSQAPQSEAPQSEAPQPEAAGRKGSDAGADRRMEELFGRLECLMRERKVYRDPRITREGVAALLETNRTYLTHVIGTYAGQTFLAYINTFRIEEAVRVLSDSTQDTPIKALVHELGFGSLSTFYKLFSAAVGYTPSQYRTLFSGRDNLPHPEK